MEKREINIVFHEYSDLAELAAADQELCREAETALATSHSPYSKFRVGAAVRLKSGKIVRGSNQENVAYPSGLCAERVVLFSAAALHPNDPVISMAITAHTDQFRIMQPVTSCGACLQVMAEYENKHRKAMEVLFYCLDGQVIKVDGVKSLVPFLFVEDRLEQ